MFGVNVVYKMKPGLRQEFLDGVIGGGIQNAIRQEPGCLQYDFFLPVSDENTVLLVEKWTDREAQAAHMELPNIARLRVVKNRCVDDMVMTQYDL